MYTETPSIQEMLTLNPHFDSYVENEYGRYLYIHLDQTDPETGLPAEPFTMGYNLDGLAYITSNNNDLISQKQQENADIVSLLALFQDDMDNAEN